MTGLFRKIGRAIGDRVQSVIHVSQIFTSDVETTLSLLAEAIKLLETWYFSYMQVRRFESFKAR